LQDAGAARPREPAALAASPARTGSRCRRAIFRFDNERVKVKVLVMTLLLNGLSEDQQRELLAAGSPRSLKPRDVLGAQGEPAESIALVQVGHLKLGQVNADGAETLLRFIGPGDCYGAIALSPGRRFPVSAVAIEPSRVLVWPRMAIVGLAERIPQIRLNLFEEVTRRMGSVLTAVQDLAAERAPVRIARALLRVAEHGGEHSAQGVRIVHPITRQEIADLTGTTLFTVSRLMSKWESDGLLRTGRGAVTIVDPAGLELAASSSDD
jgi:CRP-like cAMP-binding protein